MLIETDIDIRDVRWTHTIDNVESMTNHILDETLAHGAPPAGIVEISIVLADDAFIRTLNAKHRGKDSPTNVLSFPLTDPADLDTDMPFAALGDIVMAFETIEREAQEQGKSFTDHYTHMLVHGALHLLHFDHQTQQEAAEMEALEIKILKTFDIKNPYEIS